MYCCKADHSLDITLHSVKIYFFLCLVYSSYWKITLFHAISCDTPHIFTCPFLPFTLCFCMLFWIETSFPSFKLQHHPSQWGQELIVEWSLLHNRCWYKCCTAQYDPLLHPATWYQAVYHVAFHLPANPGTCQKQSGWLLVNVQRQHRTVKCGIFLCKCNGGGGKSMEVMTLWTLRESGIVTWSSWWPSQLQVWSGASFDIPVSRCCWKSSAGNLTAQVDWYDYKFYWFHTKTWIQILCMETTLHAATVRRRLQTSCWGGWKIAPICCGTFVFWWGSLHQQT